MDYEYPKLKKIFDFYNGFPHDTEGIYFVACQHLMEPQLKMFEYLIKFGLEPKKMIVLGKTYSTNHEVLKELQGMNIRATQPRFTGISFDQEHKNDCETLLQEIPEGVQCIVLDDGAQLIKTFMESNHKVIFGIEQTSSGFRSLENEEVPFPVLNVARSVTKLTQEAPLVARHLNERILNYLKQNGVENPKILVVGLGPIGESIREDFEQNGVNVEGFDTKYGHKDLAAKIHELEFDVIIGATGSSILTKDEVEGLKLSLDAIG